MIRRASVAVLSVVVVSLPIVAAPRVWAAEGGPYAVELFHPQSDDQGHYVTPVGRTRITVFGMVAPADDIESVKVNGRPAQLFPTEMRPYGAAPDARVVEFRADHLLKGERNIIVTIKSALGGVQRSEFVPDTEAASARILELTKEEPNNAMNRCRLGNALKDQGKTEEAIAELKKAISEGDACISTHVTLGKALASAGLPEEALEQFRLAVETDPDYAMGWLNLGLVHARFTGNTEAAIGCFKRYLELEPNSSIADKIKRYIEASEAEEQSGR
jgi:hypothetical protein